MDRLFRKDSYIYIKPAYKNYMSNNEIKDYNSKLNPFNKQELKEYLEKLNLL